MPEANEHKCAPKTIEQQPETPRRFSPKPEALMPDAKPDVSAQHTPRDLFAEAQLLLDKTVCKALRRYFPRHTANDVMRFKQRVDLLLLKDDQKKLGELKTRPSWNRGCRQSPTTKCFAPE